jgi:hypothetical protein
MIHQARFGDLLSLSLSLSPFLTHSFYHRTFSSVSRVECLFTLFIIVSRKKSGTRKNGEGLMNLYFFAKQNPNLSFIF